MKIINRVIIVPVIIALFSYLFYSAYKNVKDRTLSEFNIQQFTLARQASKGIESFFIYFQRELSFLSDLSDVSDLTLQGKDILSDFYKNHCDQIEAVSILDSEGVLRFTCPVNNQAIGRNISNQPHVRKILLTHQPTVSDVFISVQGFRTIAFHIPIIKDKIYKGSIAVLIPIDNLGRRFVENIRTIESGYAWMISEKGIVLFNPKNDETGMAASELYKNVPSVIELLARTSSESEGTSTCYLPTEANGRQVISRTLSAFYRVTIGNTFWTILIFTPEEEVYRSLTSFRNRLFGLVLLIVGFMTTYFYLSFKASNILKEEKKRKAVEKTLVESEKRFRIMFELSPAGIILIDRLGNIIEANPSFHDMIGYSRDEVIGNNIRLFASPSQEDEIERNIARILSGKTIAQEVTNIKKDGTKCNVALYETMIMLSDGSPGILSVSNDITEKKRSQERMLTLSRALESIGECVSITDLQNRIIFVNNAFCKTYGYSEDEIKGKNITMLRSVNETISADLTLSATKEGGWTGELLNVKKDGTEFPIELSTSSIKDENGNIIALIGIAVDITERKRAQKELINAKEKAEESDRLKSAFLANMSHELRTPLNAIIGFSGLITESNADSETVTYSDIISKSGQHLLSLVEDILDTSLIEIGQIKINYEKTEIFSLMEDVKNIITGEQIRENKIGVDIIMDVDQISGNKYLVTDIRKLRQVLLNLLRNALKFTDSGYIKFGFSEFTEDDNSFFQFYIKDTGIGIDKKDHDIIFNLFRQVDDSSTRKFGGIGLGLSIVKKTVDILGGKIWVESEPGKGSIFYFSIADNSKKIMEINITSDNTTKMEKNYSGRTVLIAEDEQSNFDFLRILLNRLNINVVWAKDGSEAVDICENNTSIDMVFMDIKMPKLNGYEATRLIKKKRPGLAVIAQTAYAMANDQAEAERAGCIGYLSKPLKINQIYDILDKYLQ